MSYRGWKLNDDDREKLLGLFSPLYPDVIAHHVTFAMGEGDLPPECEFWVTGEMYEDGVQALIVKVFRIGTEPWDPIMRPDGGPYHITWSIDREAGRKPYDSNRLITGRALKIAFGRRASLYDRAISQLLVRATPFQAD